MHREGLHVGCLHQFGLQLAGKQALVDIVQHLVYQLGHDEGLPGQRVGNAQLGYQEHPPCMHTTYAVRLQLWGGGEGGGIKQGPPPA